MDKYRDVGRELHKLNIKMDKRWGEGEVDGLLEGE